MPTYDYLCEKCSHRFEFFQSMNDDRLTDCPEENCDGKVKRLIGTGAGIIFKGSGFYETDYRSESYKKEASDEKSGASSDKKADDGPKKADKAQAGKEKTKEPSPASSSNGDSSAGGS